MLHSDPNVLTGTAAAEVAIVTGSFDDGSLAGV